MTNEFTDRTLLVLMEEVVAAEAAATRSRVVVEAMAKDRGWTMPVALDGD